jgi:hypothetical protein
MMHKISASNTTTAPMIRNARRRTTTPLTGTFSAADSPDVTPWLSSVLTSILHPVQY